VSAGAYAVKVEVTAWWPSLSALPCSRYKPSASSTGRSWIEKRMAASRADRLACSWSAHDGSVMMSPLPPREAAAVDDRLAAALDDVVDGAARMAMRPEALAGTEHLDPAGHRVMGASVRLRQLHFPAFYAEAA